MTLRGLVQMAVREVASTRVRSAVSAAGIALGTTVLLVIVGLGLGTRDIVLEQIVGTLPLDMIEVVPRTVDLGLFEVGTDKLFGGTPLDEDTVRRLENIEGVAAVYPKLEVRLPMGARGGGKLFGRPLYAELFMTALPAELIEPEAGVAFRDAKDHIPVVISTQLIDMYNGSVAPALGTPRLTSETLKGFGFEVSIGRSLMIGTRGAKAWGTERARIVGVSRYAMRLGVTVPTETGTRLLEQYGTHGSANPVFASVLLRANSPADVPAITSAVNRAGLTVDESAQQTSNILNAATALAALVGLLVLALAALNIAHSFFTALVERRRELAVLRAVGARRRDLILLVMIQASIVGLAGGVLGLACAHLLAWSIGAAGEALLAGYPFRPECLLPLWLGIAALFAAMTAAALGALWPSIRSARASVARALSEM